MSKAIALIVVGLCGIQSIHAQSTTRVEFDVISIKRASPDAVGGGMRSLPDGTYIMANQPIRSVIMRASPVPAREVVGLPDWAMTDRYDITAKPPPGSTREQRDEMWRTVFAERMKLVAHIEDRETDTFALIVARSDGRLGPQLKPSTLDCSPRPAGSLPPPPPANTSDVLNRCGGSFGGNSIVSGGMTMDQLVPSLGGLAGRLVNNRTGLKGAYAFTLTFSPPRRSGDSSTPDDAPEFFTALQEQLGLKLQPEKTMVPILVIDHIERPTDN
jgi:uncharacterized protein (TIGR03435 family)